MLEVIKFVCMAVMAGLFILGAFYVLQWLFGLLQEAMDKTSRREDRLNALALFLLFAAPIGYGLCVAIEKATE